MVKNYINDPSEHNIVAGSSIFRFPNYE